MVTNLSTNPAVHGWEWNSQPAVRCPNHYTTKPPVCVWATRRYKRPALCTDIVHLPHWLITLSTPLSQHTSALSLATTPRHVLYAPPTPICCRFLVSTQRLLPVVSALLCPQFGTHSLLTFALVFHHILSVVFLKPTVLIRPSVPASVSHKWLRFGLWSTLCTIKDFIYLLTYTVAG